MTDKDNQISLKEYIDDKFKGIEGKMTELMSLINMFNTKYVQQVMHDKDIKELSDKIKTFETWRKRFQGIVFGSLILAVLSLIIKQGAP